MAVALGQKRKAAAQNSARSVGLRIEQPNLTVGDQSLAGNGNQSEIFALPADVGEWTPLQVLDPDSADLGLLYFLVGVDTPGNPNRIMPPWPI